MDVNALTASAIATLMAVAWKLTGAIVLWLVGRWLIRFALRLLGRMLHGSTSTRRSRATADRPERPAQHRAGRRDPRLLRRRDDDVRGAPRGGRRGHRRGVGRTAGELRRRRVPRVPAAVQGRRLRHRRRRHRHGRGDRPLRHDDQHARQRPHHRRQQQDLLGHDPELLGQPVPARGSDGDDQQRRRSPRAPSAC